MLLGCQQIYGEWLRVTAWSDKLHRKTQTDQACKGDKRDIYLQTLTWSIETPSANGIGAMAVLGLTACTIVTYSNLLSLYIRRSKKTEYTGHPLSGMLWISDILRSWIRRFGYQSLECVQIRFLLAFMSLLINDVCSHLLPTDNISSTTYLIEMNVITISLD